MASANENKHIRNVRRQATSVPTSLHLDTINPSLRGVIVCHHSYLLWIAEAKVPAAAATRGRGQRKQTAAHLRGADEARCPNTLPPLKPSLGEAINRQKRARRHAV